MMISAPARISSSVIMPKMSFKNSSKIFAQASRVMVGGVNSPVRAFKAVGGNPLIIQRGRGAQFFDVDGNAYTDYCLSWGALFTGIVQPRHPGQPRAKYF